jgi:hypothetical protein
LVSSEHLPLKPNWPLRVGYRRSMIRAERRVVGHQRTSGFGHKPPFTRVAGRTFRRRL